MRLLAALAAAFAALLVAAGSAAACSCVGGDPRDRLSAARAAFVGTVTEERGGASRRTYRLEVEETFKGDLPGVIEVSSDARSSCSVDLGVGERVGLLLRRAAAPYEVGICDLIAPAELEAAARPYPRGRGAGTAKLLVAGAFHDAGLAAVDGRGRLIGWTFGSAGDAVGVCPGARYAVQAGEDVSVIRLSDLAVVARRALPDEAVAAVRCLSRSGDRVAALTFDYGVASDRRRLVLMRDGRVRDLGRRASAATALGSRFAFTASARSGRHRMTAIAYADRRTRVLARGRGSVASPALSPDQRHLAFVTARSSGRHARVGVLAVGTGAVKHRAVRAPRAPLWSGNRRLAVPGDGHPGVLFDSQLRRRGPLASWSTDLAVVLEGRVWWLETGSGLRGRALSARATEVVSIDYLAGARGIAAIPGGARVGDQSRRVPSAERAAAASSCGGRGTE